MDLAASDLWVILFKIVAILFFYRLFLEGFLLVTAIPLGAGVGKLVVLGYIIQLHPPFLFGLSIPATDDMRRWAHLLNEVKYFVHRHAPMVLVEETLVLFDDDQGKDHIQCHYSQKINEDEQFLQS